MVYPIGEDEEDDKDHINSVMIEEVITDPCVVCEMPSDKVHKGKKYCHSCYEERMVREAQW